MLLLGVDVETTGLDVREDRITELGAVLWDTERRAPIVVANHYVWDKSYPPLSAEITEITGIRTEDLQEFGIPPAVVFSDYNLLAKRADCIVAHNGNNFDKPLMENQFSKNQVAWVNTPWLDTSVDVPYPQTIKTRKLTHLAAEHGFLNPFAHRAFADVLTMLAVLDRYDIAECARLSQEPNVDIEAVTLAPWKDPAPEGQKETDKAKARGFRWNGARKKWIKTVKESFADKEVSECPFPVKVYKETDTHA